jgi:hypothetical protein
MDVGRLHVLRLMASLENNNAIYQQQQQRIDQLVDMSKSEKAAGALGGLI